jgi:UDP-N-acetyl-D-glucosamine dehydrogenase
MPAYVVTRLVEALNERSRPVKGQRILLLGMAYKRNTGDARETPSRPIATRLVELGAQVVAADPHVDESLLPAGVTKVELTTAELRRADAVVLLVDHDSFDLDLVASEAAYVLDTRNCVSGPNVEPL